MLPYSLLKMLQLQTEEVWFQFLNNYSHECGHLQVCDKYTIYHSVISDELEIEKCLFNKTLYSMWKDCSFLCKDSDRDSDSCPQVRLTAYLVLCIYPVLYLLIQFDCHS